MPPFIYKDIFWLCAYTTQRVTVALAAFITHYRKTPSFKNFISFIILYIIVNINHKSNNSCILHKKDACHSVKMSYLFVCKALKLQKKYDNISLRKDTPNSADIRKEAQNYDKKP